jgi:hypothetical protein
MSVIGNRHAVTPFVSGSSKAQHGQRLAKVGYKSTKQTPAKFPSVCVSVPLIPAEMIEGNIKRLIPYIGEMLAEAQNGVIRSLYEGSMGNLSAVSDEDIGIDAICGYLESQANGDRLSGDSIGAWFDSAAADSVTVLIADKLGFDLSTPEQEQTVAKHVRIYKALMVSLSGKELAPTVQQKQAMRVVLKISEDESPIAAKLTAKLDALDKKPDMEALLLAD